VDTPDHDSTQADAWLLGNRYRVRDRVGTGGMADVFRAHDELLGRDVAVKVFRSLGPDDEAGKAERRDLELQALARLSHPNLITLFDASLDDRPAYLVTELIDGPSLADRIGSGPVPESEVRAIGIQIADALAYVHAQGMVHRDVKPANILLGTDVTTHDQPRARLSDFGIVRLLDSDRVTAADLTMGTASYLAPEQASGGDVDPGADVYSLGLALLEALTGMRSYEGTPMEAVLARLANPPQIPGDLPAPWPDLLTAMTATDPAQRPTPGAVAQILREDSAAPIAAAAAMSATTAAIPRVATEPANQPVMPIAAGGYLAGVDEGIVEERARRSGGLLLAAAVAIALILGSGYFIVTGSSSGDSTRPGVVPTKTSTSHTPTHRRNTTAVSVQTTARLTTAAVHTTQPQPSTSAAPTPTSAAPPSSSVPPTTSAAQTSTAAATTTAAAIETP